jgi:16S rRNA (guanine527-N7)-methyltransferase
LEERAQKKLEEGLEALQINLDEKQIRQLLQYLFALYKWNGAYNLTAVRDIMEMINKHILDSLAIFPILQKESFVSLADVGTGAGLPGIPLAIACPDRKIILIDSNSKKTGFLKHAELITGIENIRIVNARVETLEENFDVITSRAFSSLKDMVELTAGIQHDKTSLWAMKGKFPEQELLELPKDYRVCASHPLKVPGIEGERHFLKITQSGRP